MFPFLMSGALLFWGWETRMFLVAVLMAAAIEGSRFIRVRWEFSDADLGRICVLCWVLFLGAALVLYSTEDRLVFIFKFTQWLPMTFFPIMLAQAYGNREAIPLSTFVSWVMRRAPDTALARKSFNISFGYFAICLAAASASTQPNGYFYWGVSILVLLALTSVRPRRVSRFAWIILIVGVACAGQSAHQQLRRLQNAMEGALGGWLANMFHQPLDTRECRTQIGQPGRVKLSPKIVMRVNVPPGEIPPSLLREAAYDAYKNQTWWATSNDFIPLSMGGPTNDTIRLLPPKNVSAVVDIARYLLNGEGPLDLPQGTFEIDDLPAVAHTNRLGVAEIEAGPGLVNFSARYGGGASLDGPPGPMDLTVPDNEKPALDTVAASLGLRAMTARQRIRAVSRFFRDRFVYSLDLPDLDPPLTPLGQFLLKTKSGHCEYFATATVLLLREVGVSARYITGYAVPDAAREGDTFLIRERHAHAWALVYHSDSRTWEQIDNTPSGWIEAQKTNWWESTSDFFSNLYFQFSKWRWGKTSFARYAERLLVPLILYLLVRIVTSQHRKMASPPSADAADPAWPGLDSELFVINRRLSEVHLSRLPHEPLADWQRRLEEAFPTSAGLRRIFHLHRRLRFDPLGLESHDRQMLKREAEGWLAEHAPPASHRRPVALPLT
jgi:transglutaminase-like putative cysteine protease